MKTLQAEMTEMHQRQKNSNYNFFPFAESAGNDAAGSDGTCSESEEEAAVAAANEGNIDIGYITNLASDDIMNIREFIWNIHYIWALPLKVCLTSTLKQTAVSKVIQTRRSSSSSPSSTSKWASAEPSASSSGSWSLYRCRDAIQCPRGIHCTDCRILQLISNDVLGPKILFPISCMNLR